MKKHYLFLTILVFHITVLFSQSYYTARLSIDTIDISGLEPGDDVVVPVRLLEKSGGLVIGFQFFIEFDHSVLKWKGTYELPLPGVIDFNENMPFNHGDWLFNDNGNQMVALWEDPGFDGIEMEDGEIFFKYIFTYLGGLDTNDQTPLTWGETFEQDEGKVVRGETEMFSEKLDYFVLTKQNGAIINRGNIK